MQNARLVRARLSGHEFRRSPTEVGLLPGEGHDPNEALFSPHQSCKSPVAQYKIALVREIVNTVHGEESMQLDARRNLVSSHPCQHQIQGPTTLHMMLAFLARGGFLPSAADSTARVTGSTAVVTISYTTLFPLPRPCRAQQICSVSWAVSFFPLPITGSISSVGETKQIHCPSKLVRYLAVCWTRAQCVIMLCQSSLVAAAQLLSSSIDSVQWTS